MDKFLENLKRQIEENPMGAIGVAAVIVAGVSKFMDSASWRAEVKRREKKDKKEAKKQERKRR